MTPPDQIRSQAIEVGPARTTLRIYPAAATVRYAATLLLAHGAGAGHQHPFMIATAQALRERGLDVATFNFLYMEQKRKVPDRMPQLVTCFRAAVAAVRELVPSARDQLFIGGKSMGGRAATHMVAEDHALPIRGIVLLGYPLHPPGKPDQLRDAHLSAVNQPMLFVQGSRDAFGTPSELKPILASLTPLPTLHHVDGGDHSFKLSGRNVSARQAAVQKDIEATIYNWIAAQISQQPI